jgi:multidrug efflux pump subunit AcrA (membrane-fusion protein)
VVFLVTARGELQGGNTQSLTAPMTGGGALAITSLRQDGESVEAGDVVVAFDTTEQEFKLREAEADLAEAEQQLIQATSDSQAREQETLAQLLQARTDVRIAELECRRNELYARITARQNELALAAAQEKLRQLESDLANRKATAAAGIALQEAARTKAKVKADTARRNIESMTLKAKSAGYVAVQQNANGMIRWGMQVPIYQVGDVTNPGVAVAQIPDLHSWEATARIGELDRGHLAEGQAAEIAVVAVPGRKFNGKVKIIGGTTGAPWDRYFDCRVSVDDPAAELRPGMSVVLRIHTGQLDDVLWLPAQALFESDGRTFVYARTGAGFAARDVKLVRRSEDKVVITGLREGQQAAMASPVQTGPKQKKSGGGAMQAMPKS